MDYSFSPVDDSRFRDYVRERYERTMEHLSRATGRVTNDFMERSARLFEKANNSETLRKVRSLTRNIKGTRRGNIIHYVRDVEDCRSAGVAMQRWIMSSPKIRAAFLKQRIDGYSDAGYVNLDGNDIGESHYDYRRSVNGMMRHELNEAGEKEYFFMTYIEELREGDRELESDEKEIIADARWIAEMLLEAGIDGTDSGANSNSVIE